MGIGSGEIKESQLSASSLYETSYNGQGPYRAGIEAKSYWAPAAGFASHDRGQYIQVDFRTLKDIRMVKRVAGKDETCCDSPYIPFKLRVTFYQIPRREFMA